MKLIILEGTRGTGKSTLAFKLRQKISETTLINFTGFHADSKEGHRKVSMYYNSWFDFISSMNYNVDDYTFIFDRFYFSEMVYSQLYKNYDFENSFWDFSDDLYDLADRGVQVEIFHLTINNEEELKDRLIRDKVPFGEATESVEESMKQQKLYLKTFENLNHIYHNKNLIIHTIDTSGKTNDDVYEEIVEKLKTT